jgi:Predicted membrane protein (DUF2207)
MRRAPALLAALLLLAAPAAAQDSTIVIRSFDTELAVQPSGVVEVTEVIRLAFTGHWNGILRDLSLQHNTAEGRRQKLDVEVLGVTDGAGRPLKIEKADADDSWIRRMKIWIPGAENAERTIFIRYRVSNAIRFFFARDTVAPAWRRIVGLGATPEARPDLDELYWNATGNDWTMPIERASARIVLPRHVRPSQWAAYTGYSGSTERNVDVRVDSARGILTFTSRQALEPGQGLTVAAGWAPGAISSRPTVAARRRAETLRLWPLGLPLLAFALALRSWRRRGRDPRPRAIVVGYEPPAGMTPAEVGTLIDNQAEMQDVISTLVDLAVRGYVGIEEREKKMLLGLLRDTEYVFHQRREREEWTELLPHETRFMDALFTHASGAEAWADIREAFVEARRAHESGGELDREAFSARLATAGHRPTSSVKLSDLKNQFYRSLSGIRDGIYENLVRRGYYRHRPDQVKGAWIGGGIAMGVVGLGGAAVAAETGWGWISAGALAAAAAVSAVILIVFGMVMPARTEEGARAREAALGFREFLSRVESDRYRRMITGPEMFERYLPYAMAFGVEDRWARAFDDLFREPPDWYSGTGYGHFNASGFTSRMSTLTSSAGTTMSSSPSSSGSGGGGSSGGGSGGGGGSGF